MHHARFLFGALLALALSGLGNASIQSADAPPVGTWKLIGTLPSPQGGQDSVLALVEIGGDAKTPSVKVITHGLEPFKGSKVTGVKLDRGELFFVLGNERITLPIVIALPEGKTDFVSGHLNLRNNLFPAHLAKTDKTDLKDEKLEATTLGADKLAKIGSAETVEEKIKLAEALAKELPGRAITVRGANVAMLAALKTGKSDLANKAADLATSVSKGYGRGFSIRIRSEIAAELAKEEGTAAKAVEITREALTDLGETANPRLESALLSVQKEGLEKTGKKEEAAKVAAKLDAIELALDKDFIKSNIPFPPVAYKGRESEFNRVAVVELFTGAQCPPCVAADVAFDAMVETYKPKDVVLLQYHLHIPGPDALTNPGSEGRASFYGEDVPGTPTIFINGKVAKSPLGGPKAAAEEGYNKTTTEINQFLASAKTPIKLQIEAGTSGTKAGAKVSWSGIAKTENLKLRAVLLEDVVRYPGGNGQRLHHHLVRDFIEGVDGKEIKEGEGTHDFRVDIAKLRENLAAYLVKQEKENGPFPVLKKPLDLKKLKIVAFIQNDKTREILQAAQVDLEGAN